MNFRKTIHRWSRYAGAALLLHALVLAAVHFTLRLPLAAPPPTIVAATLLSPPEPATPAPAASPSATAPADAAPSTTPSRDQHPSAPISDTGARAFHDPLAAHANTDADAAPLPSPDDGMDTALPDEVGSETITTELAMNANPATVATHWEAEVLASLDRVKRYPTAALLHGQEDVVSVRIRVARSGEVLFRRIVGSRGYAALDSETLALIERANPLPPPPPEIREHELEFVVPIDFRIEPSRVTSWW